MTADLGALPRAFGPADPLPGDDSLFSGMPAGFLVFVGLVTLLVVAGIVVVVVASARNYRRLRQAGVDPLTAQSDLLVRLRDSPLLSSGRGTLEHRLTELDRLLQGGTISPEEHRQARAFLLGGGPRPS